MLPGVVAEQGGLGGRAGGEDDLGVELSQAGQGRGQERLRALAVVVARLRWGSAQDLGGGRAEIERGDGVEVQAGERQVFLDALERDELARLEALAMEAGGVDDVREQDLRARQAVEP